MSIFLLMSVDAMGMETCNQRRERCDGVTSSFVVVVLALTPLVLSSDDRLIGYPRFAWLILCGIEWPVGVFLGRAANIGCVCVCAHGLWWAEG
jgi:hypothetical protein